MENIESTSMLLAGAWSLAAVGVGLICGFFMGRFFTVQHESKKLKENRATMLKALFKLIESTDQLNHDVDQHNTVLASAQQEIETIQSQDQETIQRALICGITKVMESNRKLESDLFLSRYKLQTQAQELDKTRQEARTDTLCQVGNRKGLDERFEFMMSRYKSDRQPFGLMLIDVDHFKRINDTFGHQAGDEVLTSISTVLKACVRPNDFVGRLGGDEFVILLDQLSCENVDSVGNRIRETVERCDFSLDDKGHSTVVTLSMGLTIIEESDSIESLYARADKALYRSKELGRNRLSILLANQPKRLQEVPIAASESTVRAPSYEEIKARLLAESTTLTRP